MKAAAPLRDPEGRRRLVGLLAALAIAWPLLQLAEFRPAALFGAGQLQVIGGFLAGFLPPATAPDFLALLFRATLETLAMATAGTAMAFLIGAPLAFAATRALSRSRIGPGSGRRRGPCWKPAAAASPPCAGACCRTARRSSLPIPSTAGSARSGPRW